MSEDLKSRLVLEIDGGGPHTDCGLTVRNVGRYPVYVEGYRFQLPGVLFDGIANATGDSNMATPGKSVSWSIQDHVWKNKDRIPEVHRARPTVVTLAISYIGPSGRKVMTRQLEISVVDCEGLRIVQMGAGGPTGLTDIIEQSRPWYIRFFHR